MNIFIYNTYTIKASTAVILSQIFFCDFLHENTNNSVTSGWIPRKTDTNVYMCIPPTCQNLANETIPGGRWSCQPRLGQVKTRTNCPKWSKCTKRTKQIYSLSIRYKKREIAIK